MTTMAILETILRAKTRNELFGTGSDSTKKAAYHKLARQSHPDMFTFPEEKEQATKAFVHLTALWESTVSGNTKASSTSNSRSSYVQTKKNRYSFDEKFYDDDVFIGYNASYDGGHASCKIWVVKNPQDNDLASNAATAMKKLAKDVPEEFRAFFPKFIESFKYREDNIDRIALAQTAPPEGFYSIREVMEAYPKGLNGRDVAWMFKRMLVAIGNTHDAGLVHGGISPDAFIIHPEMHGLMLQNWQYSVPVDNALTAIDATVRDNYPESVFKKEVQGYRLDVYMASKLATSMLEENAPKPLRIFLKGCQASRIPHPSILLKEFDDVLGRVYGAPKFHQFVMP